ncbi:MAG: ABC transporter ATP-binding protein [Desulfurococcaceae archaeon]
MERPSIVLERASLGYSRELAVLEDVSVALGEGVHALLGPVGSGKSTLLKTVAGLLRPLGGRVLVGGVEPYSVPRRVAARLVGYAWQNPLHGFVMPTVREEVYFIVRVLGVRPNEWVVERLVPRELMERNPFTLSGGEARRVGLASVLVADQPIWLLDEPFLDLDKEGLKDVVEVIRYGVESGKAIVAAGHVEPLLTRLSPRTYMVIDRRGRSLRAYSRDEFLRDVRENSGSALTCSDVGCPCC